MRRLAVLITLSTFGFGLTACGGRAEAEKTGTNAAQNVNTVSANSNVTTAAPDLRDADDRKANTAPTAPVNANAAATKTGDRDDLRRAGNTANANARGRKDIDDRGRQDRDRDNDRDADDP